MQKSVPAAAFPSLIPRSSQKQAHGIVSLGSRWVLEKCLWFPRLSHRCQLELSHVSKRSVWGRAGQEQMLLLALSLSPAATASQSGSPRGTQGNFTQLQQSWWQGPCRSTTALLENHWISKVLDDLGSSQEDTSHLLNFIATLCPGLGYTGTRGRSLGRRGRREHVTGGQGRQQGKEDRPLDSPATTYPLQLQL